jgi:hypothetical protein
MSNKENSNIAVTGLIGLVVAPIVVGVVVNSAGKCYSKVADGLEKMKFKQQLRKKRREKA